MNYLLHRLGYPLGEVVARATINLRRRMHDADSSPAVLIRVDDFPHWAVPITRFWEFHARLADQQVPYLVAATPFLAAEPFSTAGYPREHHEREWIALADALARGELEVALHGVTHRTRRERFASEFDGLTFEQAQHRIAEAWRFLVARGFRPVAFVPPFNRLPPELWDALPAQCPILCLGPESLHDVPLLWSPTAFRGRIVVLSLAPFYARARDILRALERGRWLEEPGAIIPITLHWTWELRDGFAAVAELARLLKGRVIRWAPLAAEADERGTGER